MERVVFDTSLYISALRAGDTSAEQLRRTAAGAETWLSSVVLEELYAGVKPGDRHMVESLEIEFDTVRRILVPNLDDWTSTGKVLALLGSKYGYEQIGRSRLTNDALIAVSAGRAGATVITANAGDFRMLAEFGPFKWRIQ